MNFLRLEERAVLKSWRAHRNVQGFGLFGTGYDATVIVRQDDNRLIVQLWVEDLLAGDEKLIAIDK